MRRRDKGCRGGRRKRRTLVRISTLDRDSDTGRELESDLVLAETDLFQPTSDHESSVESHWQAVHGYLGLYLRGKGCVSRICIPGMKAGLRRLSGIPRRTRPVSLHRRQPESDVKISSSR